MSRLQHDASLRNRMGGAGNQAMLDNWTEEIHISRYLELIETIRRQKAQG